MSQHLKKLCAVLLCAASIDVFAPFFAEHGSHGASLLPSSQLFAQKKSSEKSGDKSSEKSPLDVKQPPATPAAKRVSGFEQRQKLLQSSIVANVPFRSIGPTVMSGRVVDVDANPQEPTHFYVAYASGGLWRTTTNGISFEPLFDELPVMTIGDIAVRYGSDPSKDEIWVGTGENNSSRSSYSGVGVFKSSDGGKTWQHQGMNGLDETHHIGRVILHPSDPNTAWVAALGHLYSPNPERGVFKTSDGGKTWGKTLFVDDNTGAIDLAADPQNPQTLYAAMWTRSRRAWHFAGSGSASGIYKSTDGGTSWKLITTKESGFPQGEGTGRIGLAVYPKNPNIVYAIMDNLTTKKKERKPDEEPRFDKDSLRAIVALPNAKEMLLKLDKTSLADFLKEENYPKEYSADSVRKLVESGKLTAQTLLDYLDDANAALFDAPITGLEIFRSDNGGATWKRTHDKPLENVYFTYGYYFGQIRVAPMDENLIYFYGVPSLKSEDGGKTFSSIGAPNVHVDHHALWLHPTRRGHFILGNDGGVHITYDNGKTYFKANTPSVGQFYHVTVDMAKPYNVYGGLQDNGVWTAASTTKPSPEWYADGENPFKSIMGGDGMQTQVDIRDNTTCYTGFQFGNYFRVNKTTGESTPVTPRHKLGERPLRFNWQAPILLSKHNQDIFYIGSQKVHRSFDKGASFEVISPDLTHGGRSGNVPFGTLATLDESTFRFGLLYAGSDDGRIHVTKDGGASWDEVSDGLPKEVQQFWVSRVQASKHDTSVVYCALNGYRFDNLDAHVFRSANYGKTWERIGTNLPAEPVNVIKEDPVNPHILYVGTDHGLYISLDKGKTFAAFMGHRAEQQDNVGKLPHVAVHDVVVHPRDKEIVVATHGRSLYVADVSHIQQLTSELQTKPLAAFSIKPVTQSPRWGRRGFGFTEAFEPKISIGFYAKQAGKATIRIKNESGVVIRELSDDAESGLNYVTYNCSAKDSATLATHVAGINAAAQKDSAKAKNYKPLKAKAAENGVFYVVAGKYTVEIELGGASVKESLEIKEQKRAEASASRPLPPARPRTSEANSATSDDESEYEAHEAWEEWEARQGKR
jgi:photosystem II stability/assembly factor-like uncharacterized protein